MTTQLFSALQKGFENEKEFINKTKFSSPHEVSMRLARIYADNVLSSESVAFCAGRYQAYFGEFLKSAQNEEQKNQAETKEIEHAHNFSVQWKNALYLQSLGK